MAWTAWLMGKNESQTQVECQVEFRPDLVADPEMTPFTRTIILDPVVDGITDSASARLVLRTKTTAILNQLNKVDQLGDLVESNIGAQILPVTQTAPALPAEGDQIEPVEEP